jgi:Flp pilus assembly pilin Flp
MLKAFFKRLKSQKGMSGVLVALLLVIVGVGLVAGVNSYLNAEKNKITTKTTEKIDAALADTTSGN